MHLLIIYLLAIATLASSQQLTCTIGCAQCDSLTAVCFACGPGYELTLQGQCVLASIPFCSLYLNQQQCIQCVPTYTLLGNVCQRDLSGCVQNISSSRCARCVPELTNDKGTCLGVLNCENYLGRNCAKCASGFILRNNVCLATADNCDIVDETTGICRKCAAYYSLVGYKCISSTISSYNCYLYDQRGSCYACKRGYALNNAVCSLQNQLGNVQIETVRPPIIVVPVPTSQINSAEKSTDKTPQTNSQPNPSQKTFPQPAIVSNSTIASNNSTQTNLLTIMNKLNIYCSKYQNSTCIQCYQSYYLKNGTCNQVDPLCQKFNYKTSQCQQCYGGYALNSNLACVVATAVQRDPYCREYKNNQCIECYSKFFVNGQGRCQPSNPLCRQINKDGSCKSCYDGYNISGITCAISTPAVSASIDPFCLSQVDKKCETCVNGYYVLSTTGKCMPLSLNCLANDMQTGLCTQCLPLLLLLNGSCINPIDKCMQYSTNFSCVQCQPQGYYLKNGLCYNKDITCAEYDNLGNCQSCITTYYLVNGACVFPALGLDPLCAVYVNGYCTSCKGGNYLSSFVCQPVDKNCSAFNFQKSLCQICLSGWMPQGPKCV